MSTHPHAAPEKDQAPSSAPSHSLGGRILVVDDEAPNRELLTDLLEAQGYSVQSKVDGPSALRAIRQDPPDVVLLDVMMPGMTGFRVCREIKEDEATSHLPVIMVTALSDREDRIKGIEAGADDFLGKPVDRHEVLLRVRNAVHRKRLFDDLDRKHAQLQELEGLRDGLVKMLVHDMRTPLTAILANLELLEGSLGEGPSEEAKEDVQEALAGAHLLSDMVTQILAVSRAEAEGLELEVQETELRNLLDEALKPLRSLARDHHLEIQLPDEPIPFHCDPGLIRRTVANLFGNAVKFTPEEGSIHLRAGTTERGWIRIEVEDTGPGIASAYHEVIFERFRRAPHQAQKDDTTSESSGLGLTFCKQVVEAHGGRIGVESAPGEGSLFWVELPRNV